MGALRAVRSMESELLKMLKMRLYGFLNKIASLSDSAKKLVSRSGAQRRDRLLSGREQALRFFVVAGRLAPHRYKSKTTHMGRKDHSWRQAGAGESVKQVKTASLAYQPGQPARHVLRFHFVIRVLLFALCLCLDTTSLFAASPLADAVERRNKTAVERLVEQDDDVNAAQVDGMTALHWATYYDDERLVELLIDHRANVKATNRYGVTPLAIACVNGNEKIIGRLLNEGADVNSRLAGGETPLMTAARTGKIEAVRTLLAHDAEVNAIERKGQTAFMWAAAEGNAEVVDALLEAGADYQRSLPSGFTAFFFAVREGKAAVVARLLQAGIDVNSSIDTKRTGGRFAAPGTSPLMLAVENGHFELAVSLLDAGADPNDQRNGLSILHAIVGVRKPDRGDDIESAPPPTGSGKLTSLQFVRELVARGADLNLQLEKGKSGKGILNRKGATPFLLAADTADIPLMRLLIELGADPMIPNADHCTPLMAAAGIGTIAPGEEAGTEEEALEAVALLLEQGADINEVDDNGETCMHGAAYKSSPRLVEYLAAHGADIEIWNRPNKHRWTPLKIAEGYRPGNFRPAAATIAAIHRVMKEAGVDIPVSQRPDQDLNNSNYSDKKK